MMKGDFDECLSWPFTKPIKLTLMHPKAKHKHEKTMELSTCHDFDSFQKPDNDAADNSIGYLNLLVMRVFMQTVTSKRINYS